VVEVLLATVWACFLLFKPVLEAGIAEVLSTALSEVRVTENLCADTAVEPVRDWLSEHEFISTILSLVRDVCYCHFEFVRLKSVVAKCVGIERMRHSLSEKSINKTCSACTMNIWQYHLSNIWVMSIPN